MPKKSKIKRINFDEVVSDSFSHENLNKVEKPLKISVFYRVLAVFVLFSLVFIIRIIFLGGISGDKYVKRSEANINQSIPLIAPRGIITDRDGIPLVKNEVVFSVFLDVGDMIHRGEKDKVLDAAVNILGMDRNEVISYIEDTDLESITDIILARDISREQVIELETLNLSSLAVESDYKRDYISPAFSHVVGYVGLVNRDEVSKKDDFVFNDLIGRSGLESFYDEELRGTNGSVTVSRNAIGEVESIERTGEPIAGETLETTIDYGLQEYFYNRMVKGLLDLGRTSGAGIAINPQNGEILALMSFPSFDSNNVSGYLNKEEQPLFNRAVSGVYSPGSTIKPVHATAALEEKVVNPEDQFFSAGYIEIPNPYNPDKPSRFLDWKPNGWINLYSALARSSNIYFYTVIGGFEGTKGIGINKLNEYWRRFKFDHKTGIDLPGESVGFLPNPEEKEERTGTIWRVGDTYNVSIGQGDFRITPIELLSSISAISNGGVAFTPHISKNKQQDVLIDVSAAEDSLKEVRKGMEDVVLKDYGTAHSLSLLPVSSAAKTGSAQIAGNTKTNALFVGYAPAEKPQIAVVVLIENAREGSANTIPIARDVIGWYYENRIK